MEITTSNQLFVFFVCVLCGVGVGLLFDFFRIARRLFKTRQAAATIEDLLFWIIVCVVFFVISLNVNSGEMRMYQFFGTILGAAVYFLTISSFVVKTSVSLIQFMVKILMIIIKFLLMPVIWFYKLVRKPLFCVINISVKSSFRAKQSFSFSLSNFYKFIKRI